MLHAIKELLWGEVVTNINDSHSDNVTLIPAQPHLILIEGSPGLVSPQPGAEPQGAVLGDVGRGGGVGRVDVDVVVDVVVVVHGVGRLPHTPRARRGFTVVALHQHTLAPRHFHPQLWSALVSSGQLWSSEGNSVLRIRSKSDDNDMIVMIWMYIIIIWYDI